MARRKRVGASLRYLSYLITLFLVLAIFPLAWLYANNIISIYTLNALSSIALSLFFPSVVFTYLLFKRQSFSKIFKGLGLTRDKLTPRNIMLGLLLFLLILVAELAIGAFSEVTGIPLPSNVQTVLAGQPIYFLVFTFLIAPIDEEILFRGFLVPRVGIYISALIFAIPHFFLYGFSISELLLALAFGLLAGYFLKRTRSLYTSITAHMLVNLLALVAIGLL